MRTVAKPVCVLLLVVTAGATSSANFIYAWRGTRVSELEQHARSGRGQYPFRAMEDHVLRELDLRPGGSWQDLFRDHIARVSRMAEKALAVSAEIGPGEFGGIVFHSGRRVRYHADDQEVPFRSLPHFARFAPVPGPDHLLLFRPGEPARLGMVAPADYWQEAPSVPDHPFAEVLEVLQAPGIESVALLLGDVSDCAFIGEAADVAAPLGIAAQAVEPRSLAAPLDWYRAFKTPYEVECIREAAQRAARGHAAARKGALEGASEREIHAAYLVATDQLEHETPYPNIIACDDRCAVLHY